MARNQNADDRREEARRREEDRDRWSRMESDIKEIHASIHGEDGVKKRLNRHSDRILRMERVFLIGSGVLLAIGDGVGAVKHAAAEWIKHKVLGG